MWEAHKTVIRGVLIKHGIKRKREEQLKLLLEELAKLETCHKQTLSSSLERDLHVKRTQISDLFYYRAKAALQFCRKFSYESGDKCGSFLARTLREQKQMKYIPHLVSPNKSRVTKPYDIVREFQEYYKTLYNLQIKPPTQAQIDLYLSRSLMRQLSDTDRDNLEKSITMEELQGTVRATKLNKAPGPDGLMVQYYKTLFSSLAPYMVKLFNALG